MSDDNSQDSFTETTSQGWLSRLGGALKGILIGLVLVPIAGWLLFWNEGRAVQTARSLTEGAGLVQTVQPDRVEPGNEGKLIHLIATPRIVTPPRDSDLGITPPAGTLRLLRRVEMFQWREETESETRTKLGGGTETVTTYRYSRVWAEDRIDSSRFRQQDGHQNPQPRYPGRSFVAQGVTLGAFALAEPQVARLEADRALPAAGGDGDATRYIGADATSPRIGDLRITWRVAQPEAISVIGAQAGGGFAPFATRAGDRLLMIEPGRQTAAEMFRDAQEDNALFTWILRAAGVVVMLIGFALLMAPLKVLADVIPPLGALVGFGTGLVAMILTLVLAPTIIAVAWLFYRPLLAIGILAAGFAAAWGLTRLRRRPAAKAA